MSAIYSVFTSPNHPPVPNHLPTLIVTPVNNPQHVLYSYIHTSFNRETYLLTPSPQGDLCVAKMVPPPGSRGPGGPGNMSDSSHSSDSSRDKTVRCEASRNLKWSVTNTGIHAPVYKLTLPNPDAPGNEQPLFQISKPNPNATFWTMFYFTYAGHLIPPKRIEFGKIQKNASTGGGGGTRVSITGKTTEEKAVWQTLGEGNEDMVEWIVLCAALNLLDEEIIKAADKASGGSAPNKRVVPSSRPQGNGVPGMQIRQTKGNAPAPFRQQPQRPQQPQRQPQPRPTAPSHAMAQQQQMARPMYPPQGHGGHPVRQPSPYQQRSPVPPGAPSPVMASRPPPPHQGQLPYGGMPQRPYAQMPMPMQRPPPPQQPGQGYYNVPPGQQRGPPPAIGRHF